MKRLLTALITSACLSTANHGRNPYINQLERLKRTKLPLQNPLVARPLTFIGLLGPSPNRLTTSLNSRTSAKTYSPLIQPLHLIRRPTLILPLESRDVRTLTLTKLYITLTSKTAQIVEKASKTAQIAEKAPSGVQVYVRGSETAEGA